MLNLLKEIAAMFSLKSGTEQDEHENGIVEGVPYQLDANGNAQQVAS